MRRIFPREWDVFASAVPRAPGERVVDAYVRALGDSDPVVRSEAAAAWCVWDDVHVSLGTGGEVNPRYADPTFRAVFATLVTHYWSNAGFGGDDILGRMHRIADIPGTLIHGRLDVSSPLETAWRLHQVWPASRLVIVGDEGHGGDAMMDKLALAIALLSASTT